MKLLAVAALALVLAACSSSSPGGLAGPGSSQLAPFSAYCQGTLKVDKPLLVAAQSGAAGAWASDGSHAPAGSAFLVGYDFGGVTGYVIKEDGTAAEIDSGFGNSLVQGTDYDATCGQQGAATEAVLLEASTFYASQDLSGAPCTMQPGAAFPDFSFVGDNAVATVSSSTIQTQCGFSPAYSKDVHYGSLYAK